MSKKLPMVTPEAVADKPEAIAGGSCQISNSSATMAPGQESEEKRTSNEVADFEYSYWKTVAVSLCVIVGLILFWWAWPIIMDIMAGRRPTIRSYFKSMREYMTVLPKSIKYGTLWRNIVYNFGMPPEVTARHLAARQGACSRCGKCCNQVSCPFLGKDEHGQNTCEAYGTFFWYYGSCGRFPLLQEDIDHHGCPGFSFLNEQGVVSYEV